MSIRHTNKMKTREAADVLAFDVVIVFKEVQEPLRTRGHEAIEVERLTLRDYIRLGVECQDLL